MKEQNEGIFDQSLYGRPEMFSGTIIPTTLEGMQRAYADTILLHHDIRDSLQTLEEMDHENPAYGDLQSLSPEVQAWRDERLIPMLRNAMDNGMIMGTSIALGSLGFNKQRDLNTIAMYANGTYEAEIDNQLFDEEERLVDNAMSTLYTLDDPVIDGLTAKEWVQLRIERILAHVGVNPDDKIYEPLYNPNDPEQVQRIYTDLQARQMQYQALGGNDLPHFAIDDLLIADEVGVTMHVARSVTDAVLAGALNAEFRARTVSGGDHAYTTT